VKRLMLFAAFVVASVGLLGLGGTAAAGTGSVVYTNIPSPQPGNVASEAFEAQSASEFGGQIQLAGTQRANPTVTVLMSSWGCETGGWSSGDCSTTPGATFSEPVTLNVYDVAAGGSVGSRITTATQTFDIPFRPSADTTNCTGADAGKWYSASDSLCYNGLATPISFALTGTTLPDTVIVSVAFNTTHSGATPYGEATACFTSSGGCGYDSLNVGTAGAPTVGTDPQPADAYLDSSFGGAYCDGGTGGTGSFRLDAVCWAGFQPAIEVAASPVCTPTGFTRDGLNLTAALVNPSATVTGTVDASGCNIGVYYGPGTSGTVTGANISGANYYGVVADGAAVDITDSSSIHDIGETPFNGAQHGVGVLYTTNGSSTASGTLSDSTISRYQKNGVVVSGSGTAVTVTNNMVTGAGPVDYIAQNGIEIASGASALVTGNTVSGHVYTPATVTACGLLFFQAGGVKQNSNTMFGNQTNLCNAGRGGGNITTP
jgi:hypothetical protein